MRIEIAEFVRRFLLHVLPNGFHRIRRYGLLANGHRANKLALCRSLLALPAAPADRRNGDKQEFRQAPTRTTALPPLRRAAEGY